MILMNNAKDHILLSFCDSLYSCAKKEFGLFNNVCGWSYSFNNPPSNTKILSEFITVFNLWATVITVLFLKALFIALYIVASVLTSILAVASSTNTIFVGFKIALAMLISCLSPTLKFSPFSVISVTNPFLSSIVSFKAVNSRASFS